MARGKVYLVGAGPGHPELLTLKAASLLRTCDVVVYDRLIQEEVLALTRPCAERIYMGKPVGRHDSRQQEILEILGAKAGEGKLVVRLKGGDPFLFGRGGEEVEYLAERGIAFEVIPGVSSALAAPLSAGIAVTHRNMSSCVAIVTGHEADDTQSRLDWDALSKIDTLVFLMAVRGVRRVARRLIEHGRCAQEPAAVIQKAFWHDEKVVRATLADIAEEIDRAGIQPPATLVVGEVVTLRDKLQASERDLRRPDGNSRFEPGPAPDQLLRIASAGVGTQLIGFAMESGLFDHLEESRSVELLAGELGLDAEALGEILDGLVALGLVESCAQGYRNLDLASRYLMGGSPQSLKPVLMAQAGLSGDWQSLVQYARHGSRGVLQETEEQGYCDGCEALAGFTAGAAAEKLDLGAWDSVLFIGWGGEAYRKALAVRWPRLPFRAVNPFAEKLSAPDAPEVLGAPGEAHGVIILSGLLGSCKRGQVEILLERAVRHLACPGLLVLADAFLPAGPLPRPEIVLGALGRRIARGGPRVWPVARLKEALAQVGLVGVSISPLPAGNLLVTAEKKA